MGERKRGSGGEVGHRGAEGEDSGKGGGGGAVRERGKTEKVKRKLRWGWRRWVERKSGDSGQRDRSQICGYRLLGIRDSPRDVRREKNERSWREGEERREAGGERGRIRARLPDRYPRSGGSGKRG